MTFEEYCKENNVTVTFQGVTSRPDGWSGGEINGRKLPDPVHFMVALEKDGKTVWTGHYSQGIGHAESWAKKNKTRFFGRGLTRDFLNNPPRAGYAICHDADYWEDIRSEYRKAVIRQGKLRSGPRKATYPVIIPAHDILTSLVMDASGSDQNFADWTCDLGYSDDSIEARRIWEACNEIRRALEAHFGHEIYELEE